MTEEERAEKTAELEALANQLKLDRIAICDDMIGKGEAVDLWQAAKDAHEAWVLESVDPITPAFPRFPIKDKDGNWVSP
jgi:hypothetical protein